MRKSPWAGRSLVDTFDENYQIDPVSGCWNWTRHLNEDGYGKVTRDGKKIGAHRYAWERANGRIAPGGMVVRHSCDNPKCVNPDHLHLGTQADNNADMVAKGRHRSPFGSGEAAGHVKLNWPKVREIRRRYAGGGISQRALGLEFGVTQGAVKRIVNHQTWIEL